MTDIEIVVRKFAQTIKNMRNANKLAEDLENSRPYLHGVLESHRIELLNLRSAYASEGRTSVDQKDGRR